MDLEGAEAQGAAPSAPVTEAAAAEIPTEAAEESAKGSSEAAEEGEPLARQSWADASEGIAPAVSADASGVAPEHDVDAWVEVKEEAGFSAEGAPLLEGEGAGCGAPEEDPVPAEVPELSSEPTVSVDEDQVASLPEFELEETNPTEETPLDEGVTASSATAVGSEGAALGAPDSGTHHIDLEIDDEDPDEPEALPRPLTTGDSELRTGASPASGSQPPRRRGKRSGQQRQIRKQTREWRTDFKVVQDFLRSVTQRPRRGFTSFQLPHLEYTYAHPDQVQLVSRFSALRAHFQENQLLIIIGKVFRTYREYADNNGYRAEAWQSVGAFRRNNPVASWSEVFSRVHNPSTPWWDPYRVVPGPVLTLPQSAHILTPQQPAGPPPGWKPSLSRGKSAVAERHSLGGAASGAPASSAASSSAAPARIVHLAEPEFVVGRVPPEPTLGRLPKSVPEPVKKAVVSEAEL